VAQAPEEEIALIIEAEKELGLHSDPEIKPGIA
jgi:hypothetical protein